MLLSLPTSTPVYRLRATVGQDSYGDPVESWDTPQRTRLRGASVQDVSVVEDEGVDRRLIRGERVLFVRDHADVTAEDRIEYRGEVWRVAGDPVVKRGLASPVYTVCALERVTTS
ncbi:head closure [Arthrobacter phage SWEP2]|uniref:Head closure n=1 Tax=Arthrobacter phage SWEP2 TaxID=2945958 RepID=A0A9E7MIB0_9CAUD|nr:head closure [Arthrobacter phage SWEP2]